MDTIFTFDDEDEMNANKRKRVIAAAPPPPPPPPSTIAEHVPTPPSSSPRDIPNLSADRCRHRRARSDEYSANELVNPKSGSITVVYEGRWYQL